MKSLLPFNKSSLQGRELEFIFQTISNGQIAGGLKKMLKSGKLKS
jgi:hypothetical protein